MTEMLSLFHQQLASRPTVSWKYAEFLVDLSSHWAKRALKWHHTSFFLRYWSSVEWEDKSLVFQQAFLPEELKQQIAWL